MAIEKKEENIKEEMKEQQEVLKQSEEIFKEEQSVICTNKGLKPEIFRLAHKKAKEQKGGLRTAPTLFF